jgi:hypothetical protein
MLRDFSVFRSAASGTNAMFEASLNCEIESGAIRGGLTTTQDLFGHEKFLGRDSRSLLISLSYDL